MSVISERITEQRKRVGKTQEEVAEAVGVTNVSLSRYETGARVPRPDVLLKMANLFGVHLAYLIGDEDTPDRYSPLRSVPLVGQIACGSPIQAVENIDGTMIQIAGDVRADFALECVGDSMAPTVSSGDFVLLRKQSDVSDGQIAAVVIDGEATLKRVYHLPGGGLTLVADNPAFRPMVIRAEDIQIDGVAVAFQRSLIA